MALVKKSAAEAASAPTEGKPSLVTAREAEAQRKKARTLAKQQQAAERIAAATGQLASGIAEASSAAEELKRASDQIATGAEQASSAAQESLAAFQQVGVSITKQLQNADVSRGKGEACQTLIARTSGDVAGLISNVGVAAQRQAGSVRLVVELEKQAATIGEVVKAVARIADQTNLLALNAAIEAASARVNMAKASPWSPTKCVQVSPKPQRKKCPRYPGTDRADPKGCQSASPRASKASPRPLARRIGQGQKDHRRAGAGPHRHGAEVITGGREIARGAEELQHRGQGSAKRLRSDRRGGPGAGLSLQRKRGEPSISRPRH